MAGLTLIEGGLGAGLDGGYTFADGAVTDTRLMGVLGLRLHWIKDQAGGAPQNIYQFYYYDIEEIGLDTFSVFLLDTEEDVATATRSCFGGLGAVMWPVTEKQGRYLVCRFVEETKRRGQPLPDNIDQARFITDEPPVLTEEEIENLHRRMCTFIKTDYGVVNYYLMRQFGKDPQGAALLRKKGVPEDCFEDVSLPRHATFLKNSIEEFTDGEGRKSYLSESLVEGYDEHWIVVSETEVQDGRVISCRKRSAFKISTAEASMMLSRNEYVTVFEILTQDMEPFDQVFDIYSLGMTRTDHETGEMFMEFKPDNSHAELQEFNLSDDIEALYYVTDYGQLIVAAYSLEAIQSAERRIAKSPVAAVVLPTAKYNFAQSILYEFAVSGYTDFGEFLESLDG